MKCRGFAFLFLCVLGGTGSGFAEEPLPQRIVSLSPVVTEELFLLGRGDLLVGRTRFCTKPPEAQKIEAVGNILEVSVERIVALHPDLVLAGSMTDPKAKEKLKQLGIRVEEFPAADDFNGVCESFLRLGRMVHKEKEAEAMVKVARGKVNALRSQVRDKPNSPSKNSKVNWTSPGNLQAEENGSQGKNKPTVFLQVGADPLVTMTRGSFFNDLIEFSGGINIARDAGSRIYSREKVVADDPDIIIISGMGSDGGQGNEKEKKVWQGYRDLKAVKNGTLYTVNSDLYCAPTPLSFVTALENMIGLLHSHDAT